MQLVSGVVGAAQQRQGSKLNSSVMEPLVQETRPSKDFGKMDGSRLVQAEAREKGAVTGSTYIKVGYTRVWGCSARAHSLRA